MAGKGRPFTSSTARSAGLKGTQAMRWRWRQVDRCQWFARQFVTAAGAWARRGLL